MSVSPGTRPARLCSSPQPAAAATATAHATARRALRKVRIKKRKRPGRARFYPRLSRSDRRLPTARPIFRTMKIGVLTAGGDCPGLNAVIRAVTRKSLAAGHEVVGLWRGYAGLAERSYVPLDMRVVSGILPLGGTILSTSSYDPYRHEDGVQKVREAVEGDGFDAVVAIGGEHTMSITRRLHEDGLPMIGVPKTIDNDVPCTDLTFGFDTAVQVATDAIDRLHTTAASHDRVMVVEVMGRNTGWIAVFSGIAGGADAIVIPELELTVEEIVDSINARHRARQELLDRGRRGGRGACLRVRGEATGPRLDGDRQLRLPAPRRHRPGARPRDRGAHRLRDARHDARPRPAWRDADGDRPRARHPLRGEGRGACGGRRVRADGRAARDRDDERARSPTCRASSRSTSPTCGWRAPSSGKAPSREPESLQKGILPDQQWKLNPSQAPSTCRSASGCARRRPCGSPPSIPSTRRSPSWPLDC